MALACAALALLAAGPSLAVQQAFLVQNSGFMDAHYSDPRARFKELAAKVIETAAAADDDVSIYAFNENRGDSKSPDLRYAGKGPGNASATVKGIQVAVRDLRTNTKADTNLVEATTVVIKEQFKGRPGLLWIFTNNYNDPSNSGQFNQNNGAFYNLLHQEQAVARTVVFTVRSEAAGGLKGAPPAKGFMLYALAYGDAAARQLVKILSSGRLDTLLDSRPALLKPLDVEALAIRLRSPPSKTAGVSVTPERFPDGTGQWVIRLDDTVRQPAIEFAVEVENRLYPYVIRRAVVAAEHRDRKGTSLPVVFQPAELQNLGPGEKTVVRILLTLMPVPGWRELGWGDIVSKPGKIEGQPTELRLTLKDQTLEPAAEFAAKVNDLFPSGDPLLSVFRPPPALRASVSSAALRVDRQYPLTPLVLMLGAAIAVFAGVLGSLLWSTRATRYRLLVDGTERNVAVKPLRSAEVRAADGKVVGRLSRGVGGPRIHDVAQGHQVTLRR